MENLLYASQKLHVPMSEGGGEVIAFDLFSELFKQKLLDIHALGSFKYIQVPELNRHLCAANAELNLSQEGCNIKTLENKELVIPGFSHIEYKIPESYRTTLARDDHYDITFNEMIGQFNPTYCLLQAEGAIQSWLTLRQNKNIKSLLYVQNGLEPANFIASGLDLPTCISNSKFIQNNIKNKYKLDSHLLYPAVNIDRYINNDTAKTENEKFTVLFINPNQVKGLNIFLQLAKHFTNVNFKILEGWSPIPANLREMAKQLGNVECIDRTWDILSIYKEVDLLLVPSQWEEAFGRVVVEAHAAGVPTLASNTGGLSEASGDAGIMVSDFKNIQPWADELKNIIENKTILEEKKPLLMDNAKRFTPDKAAKTFMEILNNLN